MRVLPVGPLLVPLRKHATPNGGGGVGIDLAGLRLFTSFNHFSHEISSILNRFLVEFGKHFDSVWDEILWFFYPIFDHVFGLLCFLVSISFGTLSLSLSR